MIAAPVFSVEQRQLRDMLPRERSPGSLLLSGIALMLKVSGIYAVPSFLLASAVRISRSGLHSERAGRLSYGWVAGRQTNR